MPAPTPPTVPDYEASLLTDSSEDDAVSHLPPAPEDPGLLQSLLPYADSARDRLGLDRRALWWCGLAALAVLVGLWAMRPSDAPLEESLPMAGAADAGPGEAKEASPQEAPGFVGSSGGADPSTSVTTEVTELVVHASGAVARPGVYRLAPGARVDDLVSSAGGLTPDADPARINLAAPLADGVRIYVLARGEESAPEAEAPGGGSAAPPGSGGADGGLPSGSSGGEPGDSGGLIDINSAGEAELDELPGVGPAIAASIIRHREENGPFGSVDDLLDVKGIGEAKLAEIRERATV